MDCMSDVPTLLMCLIVLEYNVCDATHIVSIRTIPVQPNSFDYATNRRPPIISRPRW